MLNESRNLYNIVFFYQVSLDVDNSTGINSLITKRKIVRLSIQSTFFDVIDYKNFRNIFQAQQIWFYFRILCFEVIGFCAIGMQKKCWTHCSVKSNKCSVLIIRTEYLTSAVIAISSNHLLALHQKLK